MGVFWSAISTSPAHKTFSCTSMQPDDAKSAGVAAGKRDSNMTPIILDTSAASNGKEKPNAAAKMEPYGTDDSVIFVPIPGKETKEVAAAFNNKVHSKPKGHEIGVEAMEVKFSEYIDRAGSKIRAASTVGVDKSILGQDGSNDKFSQYINRARSRFQAAPSFVENGMAASPTTEAEAEQRSLK